MTWSRLLATGSGKPEFRLVIEGVQTQFVTDSAMEQDLADFRTRRVGLKEESIELHSGSGIITGKLETRGFTARIADVNGEATAAFSTDATLSTFATTDVSSSATTLDVVSTAGWPTNGELHIGTECISYVGTTATQFQSLSRGFWQTIPQAHFSALTTEASRRTEVTNAPVTLEGRRVYLYAYGEGDDPQGNGTQVFIGVVARDARLEGPAEWALTIDGISRLLDVDLSGPDTGAISPRGIYYPWSSPLYVRIRQRTGANETDAFDGARNTAVTFTGFYETQDAFAAALQAAIASAISGWNNTVSIVSLGDDGWYPVIRSGATARWLYITFSSVVDWQFASDDQNGFTLDGSSVDPVASFSANTSYRMIPRFDRAYGTTGAGGTRIVDYYVTSRGSVPRGTISDGAFLTTSDPSVAATFPENRLYLQDTDNIATATAIFASGTSGTGSPAPLGGFSATLDTSGASAANSYVRLGNGIGMAVPFAGAGSVTFSFSRLLTAGVAGGNGLADVITWLINNSASVCNLGGTPLLTSFDINLGYVSQITSAHRGKTTATARYWWAPKKAKFLDWLAEECKLIGVFPALDASGKIQFVPVQLRAPTESAPGGTVAGSENIVSAGWPGWERNAMGSLNAVAVKTGYDVMQDKHAGVTYNVRDVTAYSRSKLPRVLDIAPKSSENYPSSYNPLGDIVELSSAVLGIFGRPYRVVTINVPWTRYSLIPGDLVEMTVAQLPNTEGERGVVQQQGIVLSKSFRGSDAHGTLEVLVHNQNIAGYAPFSRITAASGSGTSWTLTLGLSTVPGSVDITPWQIGWRVNARRYDSASAASDRSGIITGKSGSTVNVTFDSSWTFTGTNHLTFDVSTQVSPASTTTAAQTRWCYNASSTALISYASSVTAPARTYSP